MAWRVPANSLALAACLVCTGCLQTTFGPAADAGIHDTIEETSVSDSEFADSEFADGDLAMAAEVTTCAGAVGCPCLTGGECQSDICTPTSAGLRCAAACAQTCPDGLECREKVGFPGGVLTACVEHAPAACMPCHDKAGCFDAYHDNLLCVDTLGNAGLDGWFCSATCQTDSDCPADQACAGRATVDGGLAKTCAPKSGACACNGLGIESGATTPCNSSGCMGNRTCADGGLTACNAPAPATETCNGADDDCDGQTDDDTACADDNPCTMDACNLAACTHLPQAGTCTDTDLCTDLETCSGGKCGGPATLCDDGNPCTADSCDPVEGCVGLATAGTCSDADACTGGESCVNGGCAGGQAVDCDDGNTCSDDSCSVVAGCSHLANGATCTDGDACTADGCGSGTCNTAALTCDDGSGCTLDSCNPLIGCVFSPGADSSCGTVTLPWAAPLACNDPSFAGWLVSPTASADAPGKPAVRWQLDASPALDPASPNDCSVNVNDGKHLQCSASQIAVVATADSPRIDAVFAAKGAPIVLRFDSAGDWGASWQAELQASTDDVTWVKLAPLPPTGVLWGKVQLGISQFAGSKFRLRLRFSGACTDAAGTGWFVRNVSVMLDPCTAGAGVCDGHAKCAAKPDGTAQCTCLPGWQGDGKTCSDVDECSLGNGGCAGGACTNTAGSWSCGCPPGYSGDGKTCKDIDECTVGTAGCDKNAICANTQGGFTCGCKPGFSGNGALCADIDECKNGKANCSKNATCSNTAGSFLCACKAGYEGDGTICTDVNECTAGTAGCAATNAICTNTAGSFKCACSPGYTGDGKSCLPYGTSANPATSCLAILQNNPLAVSGSYVLTLAGANVTLFCDMVTEGGGWSQVAYANDLLYKQQFFNGSGWKWLPVNFTTVLTPSQIAALQAVSTQGRQNYVGQCSRMVHWFSNKSGNYNWAFGFRFADNTVSSYGAETWLGLDITVPADACLEGKSVSGPPPPLPTTTFQIHSKKVPVTNVYTRDGGYFGAKFGSPLKQNPAWLR